MRLYLCVLEVQKENIQSLQIKVYFPLHNKKHVIFKLDYVKAEE